MYFEGERRSFLDVARLPSLSMSGEVESLAMERGQVIRVTDRNTDRRRAMLHSCLVGRFDREVGSLARIEEWTKKVWKVSSGVKVLTLPDSLLLFKFPSEKEAKRVLKEGKRKWGEATLFMVWYFRVGCAGLLKQRKERRILIYGLPLHLWCSKLFVAIGDLCGGFRKVEANDMIETERVIVTVKDGGSVPSFVLVEDERVAYKVSLSEQIAPKLVPRHESLVGRDVSRLMTEDEWWRRNNKVAGKETSKMSALKQAKARGQGRLRGHVHEASGRQRREPLKHVGKGETDKDKVRFHGTRGSLLNGLSIYRNSIKNRTFFDSNSNDHGPSSGLSGNGPKIVNSMGSFRKHLAQNSFDLMGSKTRIDRMAQSVGSFQKHITDPRTQRRTEQVAKQKEKTFAIYKGRREVDEG